MCCKLLGVEELGKPAASWCAHCAVGKGCMVYRDRPPTCRAFQCLWTRDEGLPEEMRPDRCGVILVETKDLRAVVALTERGGAMDRGVLRRWGASVRSRGVSVVVADPRRFPHGDQDVHLGAGRSVADVRASLLTGV